MNVPVPLRLAAIAVGATAFYTWVGQLVPQKEVHPPEVVEIAADVSTEEMVAIGRSIFEGKGICNTCHTLGRSGALRFPDLEGVATRAASRVPGLSALEYLAQSLYEPDVFVVPGFNPGMPVANKPPVGLTDDEILAVVAYLQSLGGTPSVTMATVLPGSARAAAGETPGAGPVAPSAPITAEGTAAPPPTPPGEGAGPLARYGCVTCHHVDQPEQGDQRGPSLYGIGGRRDRDALLVAMMSHPRGEEDPEGLERLTMAELAAIVDAMEALQ